MYLLIVLIANFWLFQVAKTNLLISLLMVASTAATFFWLKHKRVQYFAFLLFLFLLFTQFQTTNRTSLFVVEMEDQMLVELRLREYPYAHLVESRPELFAFFKIQENLFEALDPNLYFFANHPRERVGIQEFEKFPYIFLPLFLVGIIYMLQRNLKKQLFLISIVPIALISLIGHQNNLGPFALFPFLAVTTAHGLEIACKKLLRLPKSIKRWILLTAAAISLLVLIQLISYATY